MIKDYSNQVKNPKLELKFNQNLTSINGALLNQTILIFTLFNDVIKIEVEVKNEENAASSALITIIASGVLFMNPSLIYNLLNLVEMYCYALLFDVDYDGNFIRFMMSLKQSTKLPSIKLPFKREENRLPDKYVNYGIDSSLLLSNSGFLISIIISFIVITALVNLGLFLKSQKLKNIFGKLKTKINFGLIFRICLQTCFDLTFFSLLSLKYSSFNYEISLVDSYFCYGTIVIII